jgi:hypothetical protein
VRLNHVASGIVNPNHSIMWAAAMLRVTDCIDRVTEPVYWVSHQAALLGHEHEDENDDDDHGCGAAVRDR